MKRVYCLYRVSSNIQLDQQDIPMQQIACRAFADCHGWEIVKELSEKGVSAYKLSMSQRDAILEIQEAAELEKFDVLLVFMFDRIGRRDDDTPFVVEWLVKHGIEVWSVCEGEQRFDNHVDKLTNYIRYWQAAGESERISERARTRIRQLTSEGHFTGGICPFGYQFVHQGRENKRKQPLYDLAILPEEAETVRIIFSKTALEGCGTTVLANYLNERRLFPKTGKPWNPASLSNILQNKLYVGLLHKGDAACYQAHLRIIDDKLFEEVQEIVQARKRYSASRRTVPSRSRSLLAGFLFCAACGSRLSSTHIVKQRRKRDGSITTTRTQKYICQRRKDGMPCECSGQHTYVAEKLNQLVVAELRTHLKSAWKNCPHALAKERIRDRQCAVEKDIHDVANRRKELEREMQILQDAALSCMEGQGVFQAEQIQLMYMRCHEELIETTNQLASLHAEQTDLKHELWEEETIIRKKQALWQEFETVPVERQKMILSHFISRVVVGAGYRIELAYAGSTAED